MSVEYQNLKNPNTESPFGKYTSQIPEWVKKQIQKGNRGLVHLRESLE